MSGAALFHHLTFALCVALATFTQSLTGFAFGLVLLGLVAVFHLAPLPVAANVVTVMVLANAALLVRRMPPLPRKMIAPTFGSSLVGVALGAFLLAWLSDNAIGVLRFVLGIAILACSVLLVVQTKPRAQMSGAGSFTFYGVLSGVMGGVFASAGPPMVFHLYRQPLDRLVVRDTLVLIFAVNAVLRLFIVLQQGRFGADSLALSLEALPVVLIVTWLARRYPPGWSPAAVRRVVFVLLACAGASLVGPAVTSTLAAQHAQSQPSS
ncbi:sulfite exporter TauE/SafE family protein [Paraburkholderia sp. MMS20-SJTR3]|uniref:Probable membrane transporter protein n=1 Tax=Paraburkholderia sejongensis TaxID=2886946 RepID=A0ABS8K3Y2_9BURK|nr:sulfite exporter TauE/SafE family protein [Paraburkholderia sp. MMS20-SJTR3]MCC8396871.1 sulfite exporter TauE/SafE family protein [Paraburkholderia sp. MMS20-SJTR3]